MPSTVVQIGSNTKDFTAVDILRLQEAGKLSVTDSLGKYFKDVPADKRGITILDLMTHKSGLPLYSGLDFEPVSREAFLARVMKMPLLFAPGAQQKYSNVGYSVLAAIIEQLVGDSYGGYTHKTLWQPLGMHDTGLLLAKFDTLPSRARLPGRRGRRDDARQAARAGRAVLEPARQRRLPVHRHRHVPLLRCAVQYRRNC